MVVIIAKGDEKVSRILETKFENEKELENFINEHPESILTEIKSDTNFLTINQFPTKVTGNIDVLAIDKEGEIYIVETKLLRNSDRRDVIAQALDYASALTYEYNEYEFIETLDDEISDGKRYSGKDLEIVQRELFANSPQDSTEQSRSWIQNVKDNQREGNFKIVIMMDKIEPRLKDIIYYINEKSKFTIFAIEMQYHIYDDLRIMVPNAYGVEVKKRESTAVTSKKMDEATYFEIAKQQLTTMQFDCLKKIYDYCASKGTIKWGTASFLGIFPQIINKSIFLIKANGELQFHYGYLEAETKKMFIKEFSRVEKLKGILSENVGSPMYMDAEWLLSADQFIDAIRKMIGE
jgi:hypothetical protein